MKVIKRTGPPCPCIDNLWEFYKLEEPLLGVGSVVECDCGLQYTLADSQREGLYWIKRVLRDKITMTTVRD